MNDTKELPQQCDPQPFGLSERLVRAIRERGICDSHPENFPGGGSWIGITAVEWKYTPEGFDFWHDVYNALGAGARDFTPEQFAQLKPVPLSTIDDLLPIAGPEATLEQVMDAVADMHASDAKMIDSDERAMSPKEAAWAARQVPVIAQPTPTPAPCCGLTTVAQITHRMGAGK